LVASASGFNKAAGKNQYKQSQYSKQVADLETFFGCQLFHRKGKKIALTKNGETLLNLTNAYFAQLELFKTSSTDNKLDLVISAGESVIEFLLSSLIEQNLLMLTKTISFRSKTSEESINDILAYSSHLAVIGKKIKNKDIHSERILSSPTVMIFSTKHKNKFYVGNDRKELAKNPTVMLTGSGGYKNNILKLFSRTTLNITIEAPSFSAIKTYVSQGLGVSYLPKYCLTDMDRSLLSTYSFKALSTISRNLFLIYRKNIIHYNNALEQIIKLLINHTPPHKEST